MGVRDDKDLEASEMIEQQGKEVGWDGQQLHDTFKIQSKYIHFARETDSIGQIKHQNGPVLELSPEQSVTFLLCTLYYVMSMCPTPLITNIVTRVHLGVLIL